MLQILIISAFPESNYEFGILGQKRRNSSYFLNKSREKLGRYLFLLFPYFCLKKVGKVGKSRTTCKPAIGAFNSNWNHLSISLNMCFVCPKKHLEMGGFPVPTTCIYNYFISSTWRRIVFLLFERVCCGKKALCCTSQYLEITIVSWKHQHCRRSDIIKKFPIPGDTTI